MRALNIFGFASGVIAASLGFYFAPTPAYDPEGWGYCSVRAAFPIRVPEVGQPQYGLDFYECLVDPIGVVMLLAYLAAVFLIAGALASRVGERDDPKRGAAATATVMAAAIVFSLFPSDGIAMFSTFLIGFSLVVGSTAAGYIGGHISTRKPWSHTRSDCG